MKEARFGPFVMIMNTDTSLFSPPRSPRIREGVPYACTASRKTDNTVDARLSMLARRPVTYVKCVSLTSSDEHIS
jgi:hypothetical protein